MRRGCKEDVLDYLKANTGKKVHVDELAEKVPGYGESSYSGAGRALVNENIGVTRVKRGTYMYTGSSGVSQGEPTHDPAPLIDPAGDSIKVTVLKASADGNVLLVQGEDREIYRMTKSFDF